MLHIRLNKFPVFRNYRDIEFALRLDVLATNAQISMNRNLKLSFVKLKQRIFKRHSTSYWPNVGVGDVENFKFVTSWQGPGTQKAILTNQIRLSYRALETLFTVHQRFFVSS